MNPLFFALLIFDVLALWAIIVSRKGWWSLKALAIVLALSFNFLTYQALNSGTGWPVKGEPKDALFLGCDVVEPDPLSDSKGAIYLWVVPSHRPMSLGYTPKPDTPRAYELPYSRALHKACQKAQKATQQGVSLHVGRASKNSGHLRELGRVKFYHLPPAHLPRKQR